MYYNLGNIYKDNGQPDKALIYFQKSLVLDPNNADAYNNQGIIYKEKKQYTEAINCFKSAIQLNPDQVASYYNMGVIYRVKKQLDEAIFCFQKALQLNPNIVAIHYNLGITLQEKGQLDDAIAHFQKALQINPNFAEAYYHFGIVLYDLGELDEAVRKFQKAVQISPLFIDALNNLGVLLQEKGQLDDAIAHFQKALQINPNFAEAYNGLGIAFKEKGLIEEAILFERKAIDLCPDFADAHWNMSLMLLLCGNFKEGWKEYEWRWKTKDHYQREFNQPIWDGTSLAGKTIFVYAEQGVGDQIMFASCLPEIIDQSELCVIECDKRLIPLFARSFPKAKIMKVMKENGKILSHSEQTDLVIAMGSLPKYLRSDEKSFSKPQSYIIADPHQIELWQKRYQELGDGLMVGISWRGGKDQRMREQRSIALEQLESLFSIRGINFINLQYGDYSAEIRETSTRMNITIHDWKDSDPLNDFENYAAQIAALDLIISVDNTAVHLAGALGVTAWTLIPFVPDWRWMIDREDSLWYPTLRLFRQQAIGSWKQVIAKVSEELQDRVNHYKN
jgi:tetratricopeptide (TPR) repeat protein